LASSSGQNNGDDRAAARRGANAHRSAELLDAAPNPGEPVSVLSAGPLSKADSSIADGAANRIALPTQPDQGQPGARVARRIDQGFLNRAIERSLDFGVERAAGRSFDDDAQSGAALDSAGEQREGGVEAKIVENRRAKLVRKAAQTPLELIEEPSDRLDPSAKTGRGVLSKICNGELNDGRDLVGFVVEPPGDLPRGFTPRVRPGRLGRAHASFRGDLSWVPGRAFSPGAALGPPTGNCPRASRRGPSAGRGFV
jgi:hypothetical protein